MATPALQNSSAAGRSPKSVQLRTAAAPDRADAFQHELTGAREREAIPPAGQPRPAPPKPKTERARLPARDRQDPVDSTQAGPAADPGSEIPPAEPPQTQVDQTTPDGQSAPSDEEEFHQPPVQGPAAITADPLDLIAIPAAHPAAVPEELQALAGKAESDQTETTNSEPAPRTVAASATGPTPAAVRHDALMDQAEAAEASTNPAAAPQTSTTERPLVHPLGVQNPPATSASTEREPPAGSPATPTHPGPQTAAATQAASIDLLDQSTLSKAAQDLAPHADGESAPALNVGATASGPTQPGATSASPAQPAPTPAPPETHFAQANHDRIVTGVRTHLLPNGGSMQIRLDPPELGALQVMVEMRDGVMTATFQTSSDEATRLLSHSLNQLKGVLESQGVGVERLQVQQALKNESANTGDDARQQPGWADDHASRQEQQRKELLKRMWRKISGNQDPLDLVA